MGTGLLCGPAGREASGEAWAGRVGEPYARLTLGEPGAWAANPPRNSPAVVESPGRPGVGEDGDGEEAEGERRGAVAAVAAADEVVPSLPAAGGEERSDGENEAPPGAAPVLFTGGGEGEGEPKGDPEEGEPAPPGLAWCGRAKERRRRA